MNRIFSALLITLAFAATASAQSYAIASDLRGTWKGTLTTIIQDQCGLGPSAVPSKFKHRIIVSGPTSTVISIRDLDAGVSGIAFDSYSGRNNKGSFFRALSTSARLDNLRIVVIFDYKNVKKNKADVRQGLYITDTTNGSSCISMYGGKGKR